MKSLRVVLAAVLLLLPAVALAQSDTHKADGVQKSDAHRVLRPTEHSGGYLERFRKTAHFAAFLRQFLSAGGTEAITAPDTMPMDPLTPLTSGKFLSTPGLWIGLAVTAAFLTAAVRHRSRRCE
jgi:hypothetical protein